MEGGADPWVIIEWDREEGSEKGQKWVIWYLNAPKQCPYSYILPIEVLLPINDSWSFGHEVFETGEFFICKIVSQLCIERII